MHLTPGTQLGPYEIQHFIGNGSVGEIYKARDPRRDGDVAITLMLHHTDDPQWLTLLQREAKVAAALLNHPSVAAFYSVEIQGGDLFFVTEYVEGRPLNEVIPSEGLPLAEFLRIGIGVAEAIAAEHERGIVHCSIKPANVVVTPEGGVKVLEFALVRLRDIALLPHYTCATGLLLEDVAHMSPEQIQGRDLDSRTDVFSLGVLLYEMATGQQPFSRDTWQSTCLAVLGDTPRPVAEWRRDLPTRLGKILQRALAKEPERRYESVKDLRRDLGMLELGPEGNVVLNWFNKVKAKLGQPR